MHFASFGTNPQALNYTLAGRQSLEIYIHCIYYIRRDIPGLFNDPSNSFSEVCWSAMLNESKMCFGFIVLLLSIQRILDCFSELGMQKTVVLASRTKHQCA